MSNLDELIERLCPDGVEYKEINDCTIKVQNIKWKSYVGEDKQYIDLSSVDRERNIITETQNINADTAPSRAKQIVMKDDIILGTTRPMLKRYCIIPEKYDGEICSTGFCVLRAKTDIINPRWLYHNITTKKFFAYVEKNQQGASYPAISDTIVKAFKLPVPPLEVQREIVRILDNFTFLTTELAAELAARQKQYEYYRDKLLTPKAEIKTVELGEVCTFVRGPFGGALKKEIFKPHGYAVYEQQHAIYRTLDFRYFIDKKKFDELKRFSIKPGDMIVSCSGTIGKTFIIPEDALEGVINQALLKLTPHDELNVFYLQYLFENTISKELNGVARGGAIKNVPSVSELKAIKIPVPSLDVQERLVQVLDNFDAICSDLNIGLPAEIEARQKQYEYYRDKLLTFKELKKEA